MLVQLAFSLFQPAVADEFIESISDPIELEISAGWPRTFPMEDGSGWHLLYAMGGRYYRVDMSNDLFAEDIARDELTPPSALPETGLKDHSISQCPDGTYLHVASANVTNPNDSAYAFRYDSDFSFLSSSALEEEVTTRDHNDLPSLCSDELDVTVFGGPAGGGIDVLSTFFHINDDSTPGDTVDVLNVPRTAGNTLLWDGDIGGMWVVELDNTNYMDITLLDTDLQPQEMISMFVLPEGHTGGWPQAAIRVGEYWLVAFITQDLPGTWNGLVGDVMLGIFDIRWEVQETYRLTELSSPNGAMTPGLSRRNDTLILTFDKGVVPHIVEVKLNTETFEVDEDPFSYSGDTDEDGGGNGGGDCGCASSQSPAFSWLSLALGLGLAAQRRRKPATTQG